jgi:hypothetical protein
MKFKFIVLALALVMAGSTVVVILKQSHQSRGEFVPTEEQLPSAISNYSKTFKLNTNPPIWTPPANGSRTTN